MYHSQHNNKKKAKPTTRTEMERQRPMLVQGLSRVRPCAPNHRIRYIVCVAEYEHPHNKFVLDMLEHLDSKTFDRTGVYFIQESSLHSEVNRLGISDINDVPCVIDTELDTVIATRNDIRDWLTASVARNMDLTSRGITDINENIINPHIQSYPAGTSIPMAQYIYVPTAVPLSTSITLPGLRIQIGDQQNVHLPSITLG